MSKQRLILNKLIDKYAKDKNVRGVLLYGSVAKGIETEYSDIDLWIYKKSDDFIHRIDKIDGIKIDLFEISLTMLEKFLIAGEAPAVNSLLEGEFILNKDIETTKLINIATEARNRLFIPVETMPRNRILNILIHLKDLIDDSKDSVNDKLRFRLVFSDVIVEIYNNIYDFYGIWRGSPKDTLQIFEKNLPNIYLLFQTLVDDNIDPMIQISNAEKIVDAMAIKYGGIPESHIITEVKENNF